MSNLIKALTILLKYGDPKFPTHCEHDVLLVPGIEVSAVSAEDVEALDGLGFFISEEFGCFASFRFGSC